MSATGLAGGMISPGRPVLLLAALLTLAATSACKPREAGRAAAVDLKTAREGFTTHLIKQTRENSPPDPAPTGVFDLVQYPSPVGSLAAYVSPDPKDGKRHPVVIWLTGGFGNSISRMAWADGMPADNDQSAAAYREAGLAMMYPSLRGGNDNPGFKEGQYGEVDDVLAAAAYLAKLPWVDPQRIYLGGHSTGGTLALLTAEAAAKGQFRAVIAFGPVESVAGYGQEILPFDIKDAKETRLRAPALYLSAISSPTLVIEGDTGTSNSDSLQALRKRSTNPLISFTLAKGMSHFSVLHPANALLAAKILKDDGPAANLQLSSDEIAATVPATGKK